MAENLNQQTTNNRGRKRLKNGEISHARKAHKVYFSDEEWKTISEKSRALNMLRSDYIRTVSLDYRPLAPDPEFRNELKGMRTDLKKFFIFVNSQDWNYGERKLRLADAGFFGKWTNEIFDKYLVFLDKWINRFRI